MSLPGSSPLKKKERETRISENVSARQASWKTGMENWTGLWPGLWTGV